MKYKKKTILVVDDEESLRAAIRESLVRNYRVLEASEYSGALEHVKNPVDLLVIDYNLPGRNGFEVLKAIRESHSSIPAIIITAYSTETVAIGAVKSGATDYIRKPFNLDYFLRRVSELLEDKEGELQSGTPICKKEFMLDSVALYIEENYRDAGLTLDKAASKAGMDKSNFCRIFKARFGLGFVSYLNNVRIKNAVELFRNELNLSEIAFFVGYRSVEYFNRVFKKVYGVTPGEYRRKIK
ncbi:MAG: response regulator transcription factor [Nitrospirota bacterium]